MNKSASSRRKVVLVIDDNETLDKILASMMGKEGQYEVVWTKNGHDGIEKALLLHPDIIVLDLFLPEGENGWQVARSLRSNRTTADIPILIASGEKSVFDDKPVEFNPELADGYLRKPYFVEELGQAIEQAIASHDSINR